MSRLNHALVPLMVLLAVQLLRLLDLPTMDQLLSSCRTQGARRQLLLLLRLLAEWQRRLMMVMAAALQGKGRQLSRL